MKTNQQNKYPHLPDFEPIAIIGIGCRFPGGVNGPEEFWRFLQNGRGAICDIPPDRWNINRFYDPDPKKTGKMYIRQGGFLREPIDLFDSEFFGISPREAASMDPQQKLLLEVTWEAFEDAGIPVENLKGGRVGVYIGGFTLDSMVLQFRTANRGLINPNSASGTTMGILANRLSYFFDFHGPSMTMDTACSSALTALHYACRGIWNNECNLAICGGVNLILVPEYAIAMCKGQFLAPDARCKTFDAAANGYARGEGAGIVILKPLSQALLDQDPIYALVRGVGVNQDGRTLGISLPNSGSQQELLREVYLKAKVSPSQVQYIEAHGTGTKAGDAAEIAAIGEVIGRQRKDDQPLIVGSVKTNIGHLEAAAGAAGLIKTALCLKHQGIPPHLNLTRLNPEIPFQEYHLRVPLTFEPWPEHSGPAIAGVNSFGYGGSNAHAVLEEPPSQFPVQAAPETEPDREWVFPLSARNKEALTALAGRYLDFLGQEETTALSLAEICRLAGANRSHHSQRLAICAGSKLELQERITNYRNGIWVGKVAAGRICSEKEHPLVFVYSGMGPQWPRMGQELFQTEPVFRETLNECEQIFRNLAGWSLTQELMRDEAASRMGEAQIAQPLNFALQVCLTALWRSWGIEPAAVVGHSVGEIAAWHTAGALNLEAALTISFYRSRAQQRLSGAGKMLAVAASPASIQNYLKGYEDQVSLAAVNSQEAVTIAGATGALAEIAALLEKEGVFHRYLAVDIPYHSRFMEPLKEELLAWWGGIQHHPPRIPLYSTVTGQIIPASVPDHSYWWRNARQPVLLAGALAQLIAEGFHTFLEIGPHPVLAGYLKEALQTRNLSGHVLASQRRNEPQRSTLLDALSQLYILGYPLPWEKIYSQAARRFVSLPKYPWQREAFLLESEESKLDRLGPVGHPLLGSRLKTPQTCWETELNPFLLPFLADHRVGGNIIFPGAGYVETGLAIDRELNNAEFSVLESLQFMRPLTIQERDEPILHTQFNPAENMYTIYSALPGNRGSWIIHATGKISPAPAQGAIPRLNLDLIRIRCALEVATSALYTRLEERGLQYGPYFQLIKELWKGDQEVFFKVKCESALLQESQKYRIHPAIVDAGFQAMVAIMDTENEGYGSEVLYLPAGAGRIQFYQSPGSSLWGYAVLTGKNRGSYTCDLSLADETGLMVARLEEVRFQAVPGPRQKQTPPFAEWLYEWQWQEYGVSNLVPDQGLSGNLLIFSETADLAAAIGNVAAAYGMNPMTIHKGDCFRVLSPGQIQIRPDQKADLQALINLAGPGGIILYMWNLDSPTATLAPRARACDITGFNDCLTVTYLAQCLKQPEAKEPARLILITQGAQAVDPGEPVSGLSGSSLWGLGRVIRNEAPELACLLADLDPGDPAAGIQPLLAFGLSTASADEIAFRNGHCYQRRLVRIENSPSAENPETEPVLLGEQFPAVLAFSGAGPNAAPEFHQTERRAPAPGEIEIQVQATAIDPADLRLGGDPGGIECWGRVSRSSIDDPSFQTGMEVIALHPGCFRSFLTLAPESPGTVVFPKPEDWSPEETLQFIPYLTAAYALSRATRATRVTGETRIFIRHANHPTGLAAVQLALKAGAEVYLAVERSEERQFFAAFGVRFLLDSNEDYLTAIRQSTTGQGVDLLFEPAPDEGLHQDLSLLTPGGHLIIAGRLDAGSRIHIHHWQEQPNFSLTRVELEPLLRKQPGMILDLAREIKQLLSDGELAPLPVKVYPASAVKEAIAVVAEKARPDRIAIQLKDQRVTLPKKPPALFQPRAAYLITGGLGGFGLETAGWMAEHGARHLILAGRSGASSPAARKTVAELRERGLEVQVVTLDLSQEERVGEVIERLAGVAPPLRGVIHCAGVLADSDLARLDREKFATVMAPKASGAWNLHCRTLGLPLDFFILFSSVSAVTGNPGQGNYAAANAFLEGLTRYRRAMGLPSLCVDWGVIAATGMAERNPEIIQLLEQSGFKGIPPRQALQALEFMLRRDCSQAVVVDLDWDRLGEVYPQVAQSPRFASLSTAGSSGSGQASLIRGALQPLNPQERLRFTESLLTEHLARILNTAPDRVDPAIPFGELGVDSLMMMDLIFVIRTNFGISYSFTSLAGEMTLAGLAGDLLERLGLPEREKISARP